MKIRTSLTALAALFFIILGLATFFVPRSVSLYFAQAIKCRGNPDLACRREIESYMREKWAKEDARRAKAKPAD